MIKGENERLLYEILNDAYPHQWKGEHKGIEGRRYRFDCCTVDNSKLGKIAIEIDGGIYPFFITTKTGKKVKIMKGGHSTPEGIQRDMDKSNAAQLDGWIYLRYTPETLRKSPWMIIRDVRKICGASTSGQTLLCFDNANTGSIQVQQKITASDPPMYSTEE